MRQKLILSIGILAIFISLCFGAWDNDKPSDSDAWNDAAGFIRDNWDALEVVLGTDLDTSTATGEYADIILAGPWIDVRAHDAVGDGDGAGGGTDNAAFIQAAVDALPATGGVLYFPKGLIFRIDTRIIIADKDNITILGNGSTLDGTNVAASTAILAVEGSITAVTDTADTDIDKGDNAISVVDETGFTAGSMVKLTSTEDFSETDPTFNQGELVYVKSTAGGTINITSGAKDNYTVTAETITLAQLDMIENVTIDNLNIVGSGIGGDQWAIVITYARGVIVRGCKVTDVDHIGIDFEYVDSGIIDGCEVFNCTSNGATLGYAYSFNNLSQNCTLRNSFAENIRHAFTTGGFIPVWNCVLDGNHFVKGASTSIGIVTMHNNSIGLTIINNIIDNAPSGINIQGPRNVVSNNIITNMISSNVNLGFGIKVSPDACIGSIISGNFIRGRHGILVAIFGGTAKTDVLVDGNVIIIEELQSNAPGTGINTTEDGTIISNNKVRGGSPGIQTRANNVVVIGNTIVDVVNDTIAVGINLLELSTEDGTVVMNNRIYSDITPEMTDGILIAANLTGTIIKNNVIANATSENIDDNGTGTIVQFNTGWVTENSGTDTITTTSKAVAHGLDGTPTIINISFREQGTDDRGRWWIDTIGVSEFTLNVTGDPGVGDLDFGWEAKVR